MTAEDRALFLNMSPTHQLAIVENLEARIAQLEKELAAWKRTAEIATGYSDNEPKENER